MIILQQLLCPSLCFPKWQCKQNSFKMAFYWQVKKIATFYFIVCAHRNMSIKRSVRYEMWGKEYRGQVFDPRAYQLVSGRIGRRTELLLSVSNSTWYRSRLVLPVISNIISYDGYYQKSTCLNLLKCHNICWPWVNLATK